MIVSFAATTSALLAGVKDTTRRQWGAKHAAKFTAGTVVDAWDYSPRMKPWCLRNGLPAPHKVATIRLTQDAYQELAAMAPEEDYAREGFEYLTREGRLVFGLEPAELWRRWHEWPESSYGYFWVVRYEVVEYLEGPLA